MLPIALATLLPLLLSPQAPAISAPAAQAAGPYEGLWDTSYGRMRLRQSGDAVTGSYAYAGGSQVAGTVAGERLTFTYSEPAARGEGWFELRDGGQHFEGQWRAEGQPGWSSWSGRRVQPVAGRVWLVVLEAYWESDLAEAEYSFGDMLQSYFTMSAARHVQVRHRFFHDAEDFRRLCGEVAYLAEPVVLLISTHGTPDGIGVGGTTIDAQVIAASTRDASNLELLHLSGCSMMSGSVPARVMAQIPADSRFPISGYRASVAWDASAISDFIFLSFLLIHRMDPAEAVRQCRLVAPYTGDQRLDGAAFDALGLDVLMPGDVARAGATQSN
ncbi:MAG: hypothetical protein EYC70_11250 [Planctomycetota bacterium]|nr:MAG: hypothetical protein EYC70_11250 [Planctomycetota bacterium]